MENSVDRKPGGLQAMGLQRVRHARATNTRVSGSVTELAVIKTSILSVSRLRARPSISDLLSFLFCHGNFSTTTLQSNLPSC